jgi:hypothetical protein
MNDEDIPYRSTADLGSVIEDKSFSKDEEEESTLRRVYKSLKESYDSLDKWHAFDLTDTELKLKQQVKAHQLAAAIIGPALEAVETALQTVDANFIQRNKK